MGIVWLILLVSTSAFAQSEAANTTLSPRYAERMLSGHYETIAKEALKDIVPNDKYKLLIDVRIDTPEDLKSIPQTSQYAPLPGTIKTQADFSKNVLLGQLESINQQRNILLVLDPEYERSLTEGDELKELLKETLMGKLKLNIAGGTDKINIRSIGISGDKPKDRMPASAQPAPQPFNWVEFLAWTLAIAAIASLLFFFLKKYKKDSSDLSATQNIPTEGAPIQIDPEQAALDLFGSDAEAEEDAEIEEPQSENAPPKRDIQSEADPISPSLLILPTSANSQELVDALKTLVAEYPKLTSEALQSFLDDYPRFTYRVGYMIELLGFEQALMLFKGVSQKHWKTIGQYMAEYPVSNENPIDLGEAAMLYRYLIARIVEHKGLESDMGVFAIEGYSANDLARALEGEDDRFAAQFISGISDAMAEDILNSLTVPRRAKVLTMLSTIDSLDPETVNFIETTIQQRLSEEGVQPITISNESRIFTSLSNLSAYEEEKLFAQMAESDPGIVLRSKRFRLYPEHLNYLRHSVLEEELRSYPIEAIAEMMKGLNHAVREAIVGALTEKKALVVGDMLTTLEQAPNGPENADARRAFLDSIYEKYSHGGADFIDNIFEEMEADPGAAA